MHIGHASNRWQRASGWLIIFLVASVVAMIGLLVEGTATQALGSTPHRQSIQSALLSTSTPVPSSPAISPTPDQGPVKTQVTLQGTSWPAGSQVLLSYDNNPDCTVPNLTELSPDPKPTAGSDGTFSISFPWPSVPQTGLWYICAATNDGTASSVASFNVLSVSPPSLTILTKGPFMPGETMTVQGQNWFPGGWSISFALQPAKSTGSFSLEETATSLHNGTFTPTPITIPNYLAPGNYTLVATMEQQALEARSSTISILATPTPTPTATPSPTPTSIITVTPTPPKKSLTQPPSPSHHISGTLLALLIISGSMAFSFAVIGAALLIYLLRSRSRPSAPLALERFDEADG
ncbi:MAG TPA: hypothetical protein VKT82_25495 [Ktedonobacterales bacterium]|nr:hypothetical protein [Ktedonobacterales bacterium]